MQGVGEKLLARTALTEEEHGEVGGGHARDVLEERGHGPAATDDLVEGHPRGELAAQALVGERQLAVALGVLDGGTGEPSEDADEADRVRAQAAA